MSSLRNPAAAESPAAMDVIEQTIEALASGREAVLTKAAAEGLPDREQVVDWIERTKRVVLTQPERSALRSEVPYLAGRLAELLARLSLPDGTSPAQVVEAFLPRLPAIRAMLAADVEAAFESDPAARSFAEIMASYPSIRAITIHRIAHELVALRVPILPRMLSEHAHDGTGIDIHPGARIGRRFFIDHGTGVVIGETCEIGDNVRLYQGVTLGARSPRRGESLRGVKRHPTIEDDVTIYAGVTILGGDVVIGRGSVIGGNVWLTESVPAGSRVTLEPPLQSFQQRGAKDPKQLGWEI
jgi:serine O-acetyltransferase